jgi:hypothetical protein
MKKSKFIKQINKNNLVAGIIFIFIILISPWLWVLVKNSNPSLYKTVRIINFKNEVSKDQINILRGEMLKSKVPNVIGRVIVNKFSYYFMQVTKRYLETFDPQYLFFNGDLNINKSTKSNGVIYLSFLPLIFTGIYISLINKDKLKIFLLLISPLLAAFVDPHYESISRIPVFIMLSYFSAIGFLYLFKKKKWLALLITFLIFFEFSRFVHDFLIHYPGRLIM